MNQKSDTRIEKNKNLNCILKQKLSSIHVQIREGLAKAYRFIHALTKNHQKIKNYKNAPIKREKSICHCLEHTPIEKITRHAPNNTFYSNLDNLKTETNLRDTNKKKKRSRRRKAKKSSRSILESTNIYTNEVDTKSLKRKLLEEIKAEKILDDEYRSAKKIKQASIDELHNQLKDNMSGARANNYPNNINGFNKTNKQYKTNQTQKPNQVQPATDLDFFMENVIYDAKQLGIKRETLENSNSNKRKINNRNGNKSTQSNQTQLAFGSTQNRMLYMPQHNMPAQNKNQEYLHANVSIKNSAQANGELIDIQQNSGCMQANNNTHNYIEPELISFSMEVNPSEKYNALKNIGNFNKKGDIEEDWDDNASSILSSSHNSTINATKRVKVSQLGRSLNISCEVKRAPPQEPITNNNNNSFNKIASVNSTTNMEEEQSVTPKNQNNTQTNSNPEAQSHQQQPPINTLLMHQTNTLINQNNTHTTQIQNKPAPNTPGQSQPNQAHQPIQLTQHIIPKATISQPSMPQPNQPTMPQSNQPFMPQSINNINKTNQANHTNAHYPSVEEYTIVITLQRDCKTTCNISLCRELLNCKPEISPQYEARFINNKTIIIRGTNQNDKLKWLNNWPRNAFGGEIYNIQEQFTSKHIAAIHFERKITGEEAIWLKDRYSIINVIQKRNNLHQVHFANENIFKKVIGDEYIYLARCKIKIKEWVYFNKPLQCLNCQQFGHKHENCNNKAICKFCSQSHASEDCPISDNHKRYKCINCIRTEDSNHRADDRNCTKYKQENSRLNANKTQTKNTNKNTDYDTIIKNLQVNQDKLERNLAKTVLMVQDVVESIQIDDIFASTTQNINVLTYNLFDDAFNELIKSTKQEIKASNTVKNNANTNVHPNLNSTNTQQ